MFKAGRCEIGFIFNSGTTSTDNNCIGVTNKLFNNAKSGADSACPLYYNSRRFPYGPLLCKGHFQRAIKVLKQYKKVL